MTLPTDNPVTMDFGSTAAPYSATNPHKGVDFGWRNAAGQADRTIYMPEAGTVTLVPNNGNDGNGVYFTGATGRHGLLHTSQYLVANGTYLDEGQPVAIMGDTGAAQGVHLHWALRVNGVYVDGRNYVTEGDDDVEIGYDTANQIHQDLCGQSWGKASWEANAKGMNFADTYSFVQHSQARTDYQKYISDLEKTQNLVPVTEQLYRQPNRTA